MMAQNDFLLVLVIALGSLYHVSNSTQSKKTRQGAWLAKEGSRCHINEDGSRNCTVAISVEAKQSKQGDHHTRFGIYAEGKPDYYDPESSTGGASGKRDDPYEKGEGKMWLVPPFLIGASSVIIIYIVMHCVYLHCYAKRKMQQLAARAAAPAIMFSDDASPSSIQPFTPIVKYDNAFSRTELVNAQPFVFCHKSYESTHGQGIPLKPLPTSGQKKSSFHLQLPGAISRRLSKQRFSTSSADSTQGPSHPTPSEARPEPSRPRASICFVPLSRAISDPNSDKHEWTAVQGFVCPRSMLLPTDAQTGSFCASCGAYSATNLVTVAGSTVLDERRLAGEGTLMESHSGEALHHMQASSDSEMAAASAAAQGFTQ